MPGILPEHVLMVMISFKVITNFATVYRNYTTMETLNVCIDYTIETFPNFQFFKTMFDGVTCGHSKSSNTISKLLYVKDTLESCLNGTEVKKVTTSGPGKNEQYCGKHISLSISISISLYILLIITSYINMIYKKKYFLDKIILLILSRLDFRDILTSDTTSGMATEPTILSFLEPTNFTNDKWFKENNFNNSKSTDFFSKDNPEVESSKYANIKK